MALEDQIQSMLQDARLPECGLRCINAVCGPSHNAMQACVCPVKTQHYAPWTMDLHGCIEKNCTFNHQLITAGLTWHACDMPQEELSLIPLICITALFQIVFFSMRVWSIRSRQHNRGLDDIAITVAFCLLMCWIPILSLVQHWGFYRNIWDLKIINLNRVTQIYFVHRIIYALALGAVKISVAGMYFRILEGRSFRYALWATQVLNVLVIVSFLISLGFACIPLRAYWAYTYDVTDSVCPDFWDWGGYYMAFNLILDVVLIALPSGYVWRTLMDLKTKIGVIVVFGLGVFTMIMTIVRWVQMHKNASTIVADDLMASILWCTLEVTTAFIIACLPATRLFVQHFFPAAVASLSATFGSHSRSRRVASRRGNMGKHLSRAYGGFSAVTSEPGSSQSHRRSSSGAYMIPCDEEDASGPFRTSRGGSKHSGVGTGPLALELSVLHSPEGQRFEPHKTTTKSGLPRGERQ